MKTSLLATLKPNWNRSPKEKTPTTPISASSGRVEAAFSEDMFPMPTKRFWKTMPWGRLLVWFMRIVAFVWLIKGLISWMAIIGFHGAFEGHSTTVQATTIYFAVLDLVAAVGLWLLTTWGGVLWLLALTSQLILAFFFPRIVMLSPYTVTAFCSLVGLYLMISWFASQQE
jgi:hypothetical protein